MSSTRLPSIFIGIGALAAILAGSIHLFVGVPIASTTLQEAGISSLLWGQLLKAICVVFSVHLFLIATLLLYSLLRNQALPTTVVIFCGLFPILDGVVLAYYAPVENIVFVIPGLFMMLGGFFATRPPQLQESEGSEKTREDCPKKTGPHFWSLTENPSTALPSA